jgi:hypothetical protein
MNAKRTQVQNRPAPCVVFVIAFLAFRATWGEVGVAVQSISTGRSTYILEITEDPSPIITVWQRFGPPNEFRVALNTAGELNNDGPPSLLSDPGTNLVAAAWALNSPTGYDVVISRFEQGAWTTPQVIAGGTGNQLDPKLALDSTGSIHLLYWVDSDPPQVFHVSAPHDLSSWSAPIRVSDAAEPSLRPSGVVWNGVLRVAYEVHNFGTGQTPREVVLARYENGVFVPEVVAITNNLGEVRPEVHSHGGKLWVDWIDYEDGTGGGELAWTRLNASGQWEPIRYEPFGNYEQREHLVRGGARMKAITGQ